MEYSKIELKGYKRLQLSNISLIRLEPKHTIQLILGMNGSGKSSLLREITPLPSLHTQYEKDGYKLLEFTHRNSSYQVINRFDGKSGKYQLIKDGIDIFQGTTVTDFRTLIKQEFGITQDIQSLIDGVTRFSTMDIGKRRIWFTLLSQADYTFAFQYYGQLKSRIRDLQGSLNISQNRYLTELSKVLSEEEILKIRERLKFYQELLHQLLELKPRLTALRSDVEKKLIGQEGQLEQLYKKLSQVRHSINKTVNGSVIQIELNLEQIQQLIYKTEIETIHERKELNELHRVLEEGHRRYDNLHEANHLSASELREEQKRYGEILLELQHSLQFQDFIRVNISDIKSAFESVYSNLSEIFSQLPEDNRNLSRQTRENAVRKSQDIQAAINVLQTHINQDQHRIEQMDDAKLNHQRTCPKCNHQWIHGYNEDQYNVIKTTIEQNLNKQTNFIEELTKLQYFIKEIDRVFDLRLRYGQIVRSWPILSVLWDILNEGEGLTPKQCQRVLEGVLRDIPVLMKIDVSYKELKRIQEMIVLVNQQSLVEFDREKAIIQENELKVSQIQEKIRSLEEQQRVLERLSELLKATRNFTSDLETLLSEREQNFQQLQESLKVEHFNRLISIFRQELVSLEQSISKIDIQQNLLLQLKQQMVEHEEQIKLLKIAEQALSPSTGLIAKGLTGFINWFVSSMNQFVKNIWVYPLEILPISIQDEIELDYKFPIRFDHRFEAPDIKMGETNASTCEIFDLAFRIVAMRCLGLNNYPLQLDEFGSSFDHHHRNAAFQIVTNLTLNTDVPQIYLVSHHEQNYSGMRNVDLTVLSSENIIVPDGVVMNSNTFIA